MFFKREKLSVEEIDCHRIADFDIVLSKGQSVQSKFINLLKLSSGDYTHTGILFNENDTIFVLHATPDGTEENGIRYDDLQTFIDLSKVNEIVVLRPRIGSDTMARLLRSECNRYMKLEAPFDYDFNNYENSRLYCTELVWLIYKAAGLDGLQIINPDRPIYPVHFLELTMLKKVDYRNIAHSTK